MVERPMPEVPCRFQRMYMSLAAMKNGFRDGCRPIIGLDACFLKGVYKGQLMAAIGRDANDNMYLIAIVVVEAETKDNWTWFLEALLADLGPRGPHGWIFISDRQKVNIKYIFFYDLHVLYVIWYVKSNKFDRDIVFMCAGIGTKPT
jgi:hypothetical protein